MKATTLNQLKPLQEFRQDPERQTAVIYQFCKYYDNLGYLCREKDNHECKFFAPGETIVYI